MTSEQVPHLHADAQVAIVKAAGIELEVRALRQPSTRSQRGVRAGDLRNGPGTRPVRGTAFLGRGM